MLLDQSFFAPYEEELIALRKEFHKIPELCYQEEKTAEKIEHYLQKWGISRVKRVFQTGVVALLGDESKPCIALRMDIDGLPVEEKTNLPHASQHSGMMHACGHDAHIAILLMTAKILKSVESELPCSVKLIFQPGEEGDGGALPMILEGVLSNPEVTQVFGAHVWPEVALGQLETVDGAAFAGCARYEIRFHGVGGHGALPASANSPLPALAECISRIVALQQEESDSIISPCACHADGYYNVFPDDAVLLGTIRTLKKETQHRIFERMEQITKEISESYHLTAEFLPVEEYPPCINDGDALSRLEQAAKQAVGKDCLQKGCSTYAAEDFAFFAMHRPAAHIRIGCTKDGDRVVPLHNPEFYPHDQCLLQGVKVFCHLVFSQS